MLRLGVGGKTRRVGGEKCERCLLILTIFGEVEVHPPDQVPRRVAVLEKLLNAASPLGQLQPEGRVRFLPESVEHSGCQVFCPHHGRRAQG